MLKHVLPFWSKHFVNQVSAYSSFFSLLSVSHFGSRFNRYMKYFNFYKVRILLSVRAHKDVAMYINSIVYHSVAWITLFSSQREIPISATMRGKQRQQWALRYLNRLQIMEGEKRRVSNVRQIPWWAPEHFCSQHATALWAWLVYNYTGKDSGNRQPAWVISVMSKTLAHTLTQLADTSWFLQASSRGHLELSVPFCLHTFFLPSLEWLTQTQRMKSD